MEPTFQGELERFRRLIKDKQPFAFSRYNDGEAIVLRGRSLDMLYKGESLYDAADDSALREKLFAALQHRGDNYYVGLPCPCCHNPVECAWINRAASQPATQLTFANLFVNGNYELFLGRIIPLFSRYKVYVMAHGGAAFGALPFRTVEQFVIGQDAWRHDQEQLDRVVCKASQEQGALFLFCAGFFANLCIHACYKANPNNTYLDLGSTLDPILFYDFSRPGYQRLNGENRSKICKWLEPTLPIGQCTLTELIGGLGNQLFQICTVLTYAKEHNLDVWFDSEQTDAPSCVESPCYQKVLPLPLQNRQDRSRSAQVIHSYMSDPHHFEALPYPSQELVEFRGQFLNFGYFAHQRLWLRDRLFPNCEFATRSNTVLVGVRRFKQESRPDASTHDGFYLAALKKIKQAVPEANYLVCSDDPEYASDFVQRHLQDCQVELLCARPDHPRDGSTEIQHFCRMLQCNHFVLGNSTFHMFAAFFAYTQSSKVICATDTDWVLRIAMPHSWERIAIR